MVGGGDPFYLKCWVIQPPLERNRLFSTDRAYSLVAFQPLHLANKSSVNTNRKSTTRFPMSLRWSSYVAPKPPWLKTRNGSFRCKIALRLKGVCYKVSLSENCQRQSCKASIGLSIHAKMIGRGRPILPEILGQTGRAGAKLPIFDLFSPVAPQL